MEVYLVRHTETICKKGICYGQADVDIKKPYLEIFNKIKAKLPVNAKIYSSPLIRCKKLAEFISNNITFDNRLLEMNFGNWELKPWDSIPITELQPWMDNFDSVIVPHGESFENLHERVGKFYTELLSKKESQIVIVCHAGTIRSILSHHNKTELKAAFSLYSVNYGEVFKISF